MESVKNTSLKPFNTFGIDAKAQELIRIKSIQDIENLSLNGVLTSGNHLVLGGGSNILLTSDFEGSVIINEIDGIEVVSETEDEVIVEVGGGVSWHQFVLHCIDRDWGGAENLSLIPGSCGAAPMQNIGAYGVELTQIFVSLTAIDKQTAALKEFDNAACQFGYRTSIFKTTHRDLYIIASVKFRLTKKNHKLNLDYGAIRNQLELNQVSNPTIKDVSNAVIQIRQNKLPDPKHIGNSGSFFKNPILEQSEIETLKKSYADVPVYAVDENHSKVAAGWLIEKAGWKGKTFGNYGVHKNQALVLVNYGGASGKEIFQLSEDIIKDIHAKFGVELEREVNVV